MSEHKRTTEQQISDLDSKKMKTEDTNKQEDMFASVGETAEQIDQHDGVRRPGVEDTQGHPLQEVDSLCMNCHEQGVTKLLMTRIPYFREVILMSFECPHCGFKNSEIQPASAIQEKGCKYTLKIEEKNDLNRQVVKSESATCRFDEIDVEIPAQRGQLTTVEGLLSQVYQDLEGDQEARKSIDPETHAKIAEFLAKLKSVIDGQFLPMTFRVDDPAGNSWVEYIPGEPQHKWSKTEYFRTIEQIRALGMSLPEQEQSENTNEAQTQSSGAPSVGGTAEPTTTSTPSTRKVTDERRNASSVQAVQEAEIENLHNEVQTFHATCPSCHGDCPTHMKIVNIPHFKDVIIMSTVCDRCGYKSNEVKTGGAIPDKGRRIAVRISEPDDLARDILKSETCGLVIPELDLDLTPGTLGGRFTTVEGLLRQVHDELESRVFTETSDSMEPETKDRWVKFLARLQGAVDGQIQFNIIMEDPLAASYVQNVFAPDEDPNMVIEDYERTQEQNDELGITDMKA